MSEQVTRAVKSLFQDNGGATVNVKFFLGSKRGVTADDLAGQLNRADAQVRNQLVVPTANLDGELTSRSF